MAIYEGARPRPGFELPWARPAQRVAAPAGERRRPAAATRRATRSRSASRGRVGGQRRVATALAGIVVVFSVAFISLSQSVRVAATSYDIVRLQAEHDRLSALAQDLGSDVERLRGEPAIRKQALDAGLGQLGAPIVLPAR